MLACHNVLMARRGGDVKGTVSYWSTLAPPDSRRVAPPLPSPHLTTLITGNRSMLPIPSWGIGFVDPLKLFINLLITTFTCFSFWFVKNRLLHCNITKTISHCQWIVPLQNSSLLNWWCGKEIKHQAHWSRLRSAISNVNREVRNNGVVNPRYLTPWLCS